MLPKSRPDVRRATTIPLGWMQGKVCLITGATSGIGKAAAVELARLGGTVVIVARNQEKGERAAADISASTIPTLCYHVAQAKLVGLAPPDPRLSRSDLAHRHAFAAIGTQGH